MRKILVLAAGVLPLLFGPPALADEKKAERESVCRVPDVSLDYDTAVFTAVVSLPVTGCHSREHGIFILSASISRLDPEGGRHVADRSVECGPFRPADDVEPGDAKPNYTCDLAVGLDHPEVETVQYDVEVSYPGAAATRTMRLFAFCTSDGNTASCDE